jgi:K+ transporter
VDVLTAITGVDRFADAWDARVEQPVGGRQVPFLGRETLIATKTPGMAMWRERLFVLMARNAVRATAFFRLPAERVVELGVQVEM